MSEHLQRQIIELQRQIGALQNQLHSRDSPVHDVIYQGNVPQLEEAPHQVFDASGGGVLWNNVEFDNQSEDEMVTVNLVNRLTGSSPQQGDQQGGFVRQGDAWINPADKARYEAQRGI